MFTQGNPTAARSNTVVGVDYRYHNSNLAGSGQALEASAYTMRSNDAGVGGNAYGAHLLYTNFAWNGALGLDVVDATFNPALGFVPMQGTRNHSANLTRTWQPEMLEYVSVDASLNRRNDLNGRLIDQTITPASITVMNKSLDAALLSLSQTRERYEAPITFLPGIVLPAGEYKNGRWNFGLASSTNRALSVSASIGDGGYLNGRNTDYSANITWYAMEKFSVSAAYALNAIRLPTANLDVRTTNIGLKYAFTPRLGLNLVSQYDNVSNALGMNARLRWTIHPGSDFYLVFNHNVDTTQGGFRHTGSELTGKVVWDFRL